jgi:hypothetical protein
MFPLSGYLALFDDFTTLALILEDDKARPGLSISLSAALNDNNNHVLLPSAGMEVDVHVKVTKVGNKFGFAQAKAICLESQTIIASGTHVKYLNTGSLQWMQNILMSSNILPWTAWLSQKIYKANNNNNKHYDDDDDDDDDNYYDREQTSHSNDIQDAMAPALPKLTMDDALSELSKSKDETHHPGDNYDFSIKEYHCNPVNSLHVRYLHIHAHPTHKHTFLYSEY